MKNYLSKIVLISVGVFVVSFFLLPFFVFAGAPDHIVPCDGWLACDFCAFSQMVSNLMNYALFAVALPVGVVAIIIAGGIFITAGGSPQKVDLAKKTLLYAVIGLFIAFGAWLIIDATLGALLSPGYRPWHQFPGC